MVRVHVNMLVFFWLLRSIFLVDVDVIVVQGIFSYYHQLRHD